MTNSKTVGLWRITASLCACLMGLTACETAIAAPLSCDDGLKSAFHPDANTTIISVRAVAKGTRLNAAFKEAPPVTIVTDLCLVKLMIGPGSTKEPDHSAPGWSAGIGIEVWLPALPSWNHRIRNFGGGGWAGGPHRQPDRIGSPASAIMAANLGFTTASMDAGHEPSGDVSYAFLSNGRLNAESTSDFIDRSVVELAVKTKALVKAYYGEAARFSYFEGGSQGGRQGLQAVEKHPKLYDGYLIGFPGVYAPRFGVAAMYPQLVLRQELGFTSIDKVRIDSFLRKADSVSARAVRSCDADHLGFILDPFACNYDPLADAEALCVGAVGDKGIVGTNDDSAICVTAKEAGAIDRLWYGETSDGSWDKAQSSADRGGAGLGSKQIWWGPNRGAPLAPRIRSAYTDNLVQAAERVDLAADATATAFPPLRNASTAIRNTWLQLGYADLARISDAGMKSPIYGPYATDDADLSGLRDSGAKVLMFVPLADELIPPAGTVYWFKNAAKRMGGYDRLGRYFRTYLLPSLLHGNAKPYVAGGDPDAVPIPGQLGGADGQQQKDGQLFAALMDWVEKGAGPQKIVISSKNGKNGYPLCQYPKVITWTGVQPIQNAQNYICK